MLNGSQLAVSKHTKCAASVRLRPLAMFAEQKNVLFALLKQHKIVCLTPSTVCGLEKRYDLATTA